jgi:hypothetical protein
MYDAMGQKNSAFNKDQQKNKNQTHNVYNHSDICTDTVMRVKNYITNSATELGQKVRRGSYIIFEQRPDIMKRYMQVLRLHPCPPQAAPAVERELIPLIQHLIPRLVVHRYHGTMSGDVRRLFS